MFSTQNTPFRGPRLKLGRARVHVSEVERELSQFAEREPYQIIGRTSTLGRQTYEVGLKEPFPDSIPLAIGDAIHNLRTALDHMACDLVRLNGKSTKGVYFPFAADANALNDQIKAKNFHRAPAAAVALLRHLQPYKSGNRALRAIHDLDVHDKHELLIPVVHGVRPGRIVIGDPDNPTATLVGNSFYGKGPIFRVQEGLPVRTEEPLQPMILFAPHLETIGRAHVVESLKELCNLVHGVINQFEAVCL